MKKLLESKILSFVALVLVIAVTVATFVMKLPMWCLIAPFFAFMMAFCHLVAQLFTKMNPAASRKMDIFALVFAVLSVLAFIVEFILLQ